MPDKTQLCIHGHFYQPPREDPFTDTIPDEPGASPYQNWNEKILETCYRPNALLRNFSRISFNIGPTLAQWLKKNAPEVLSQITNEDKLNIKIFGAGNALAQPFNHSILPLLNLEDKRTQVMWGIESFRHIFGHQPKGMWLPETAANLETLCVLEEFGIEFIILAPWQVEEVEGTSPYRIDLGKGRSILAFVYHGGLSSTMSFDTFATGNADAFAQYYIKPEITPTPDAKMLLIATDGELYGHHQPFRDKFLAHLLDGSIDTIGIRSVFPGVWLKENKVTGKARLRENTSWSCHHGVERWRGECGCTPGSTWKKPLRNAFNQLAENITSIYLDLATSFGFDPVAAQQDYIQVMMEEKTFEVWVEDQLGQKVDSDTTIKLEKVFHALYERQRMFTSCGWFFDDLSRLEPRNNLAYAAHAAWLIESATGKDSYSAILPILNEATDIKSGANGLEYFSTAFKRFSGR